MEVNLGVQIQQLFIIVRDFSTEAPGGIPPRLSFPLAEADL